VPLAFANGVRTVPVRAVATLTGPTAAGTYTDTVRVTLTW
jgi:spore coat protein U-like protein